MTGAADGLRGRAPVASSAVCPLDAGDAGGFTTIVLGWQGAEDRSTP
jgi:hypothetical protein